MPKFKIGVWEEQGGYLYITAKTKKQAEAKALKHLEANGIDETVDITHRNFETLTIELDKE